MRGWRRAISGYWATRFMRPGGGMWMPGTWSATECKREDLSEQFWLATKPHRKDFEELGFIECRFNKIGEIHNLNPALRDSGGVSYLDPTRRYFGLLLYHRIYHRRTGREVNEIIIAFTAALQAKDFSCTNHQKAYDPPADSEVIRLNSYDVKFIYHQFLQVLQQRKETPRQFADLESLKQWFDARQLKAFEDRVGRRLFIPMTEAEVTAAKAQLQSGAPPIPRPRGRLSLSWAVWLAIVAFIFLLELMHRPLHGAGRTNTMEFRGQQFKLSKAYADYDDYKDDPNNLDTNELDRIEQIMTSAKVPAAFQDRQKFFEFMTFELTFPGYGASSMGGVTDDGSQLDFESVEIPQRDKDRVVLVREAGGQLKVVDDFVYNTATNEIESVELKNQMLRYYDAQKHLLREKHL